MILFSKAWEESICVCVITAHNLSVFSLRLDGFWAQICHQLIFPPKIPLNWTFRTSDWLSRDTCVQSQLFGLIVTISFNKKNFRLCVFTPWTLMFQRSAIFMLQSLKPLASMQCGQTQHKDRWLLHSRLVLARNSTHMHTHTDTQVVSASEARCVPKLPLCLAATRSCFFFPSAQCFGSWLRQLAGQLLRSMYRFRGLRVCWESSLTRVCVTLETNPVLWSSLLSQHQSQHTEHHRTSQGPLPKCM